MEKMTFIIGYNFLLSPGLVLFQERFAGEQQIHSCNSAISKPTGASRFNIRLN